MRDLAIITAALCVVSFASRADAQTVDCGQAACVAFAPWPSEVEVTTRLSAQVAYRFQAGTYSFVDSASGQSLGAKLELTLPAGFYAESPQPSDPWVGTCTNVPAGVELAVWHRHCTWTRPPFTVSPGQTEVGSVATVVFAQPYLTPTATDIGGFEAAITVSASGVSDTDATQLRYGAQGAIGFRNFVITPTGYGYTTDSSGTPVLGRSFKLQFILADGYYRAGFPFDTTPDPSTLGPIVRAEPNDWRYGGNAVDSVQAVVALPDYAILADVRYFDSIYGNSRGEGAGHWTSTRPTPGALGGTLTFAWNDGARLGYAFPVSAGGGLELGQYGPPGVNQAEADRVELTLIVPCEALAGLDLDDPSVDHGAVFASARENRVGAGGALTYAAVDARYPSVASGRRLLANISPFSNGGALNLAQCGMGDGAPITRKMDDQIQWIGYVAPSHYDASWNVRFEPPGGVAALGPTQVLDVVPPYARLSSLMAFNHGDYDWSATDPQWDGYYCKLPRSYVAPDPGIVCTPGLYDGNCHRGLPRSHRYEVPDPADLDLSTPWDGSAYGGGPWPVGWNQALGGGCVREAQLWLSNPLGSDPLNSPRSTTYDPGTDPGTHLKLHDVTHVFWVAPVAWSHPDSTPESPRLARPIEVRYRTTMDLTAVHPDMVGATPLATAAIENVARIAGGLVDPLGPQGPVTLDALRFDPGDEPYATTVSWTDAIDDRPDLEANGVVAPLVFGKDDADGMARAGFHNRGRGDLRNVRVDVWLPDGFEPAPIDASQWPTQGNIDGHLRLPDSDGADVLVPGFGVVPNHLVLVKDACFPSAAYADAWAAIGEATLGDWADSATASTFYPGYEASDAIGPPDAGTCGDSERAWSPSSEDPGITEWLEVGFASPVASIGVDVAEIYSQGRVTSVDLVEPDGTRHDAYWPRPGDLRNGSCDLYFRARWPLTPFVVAKVRLHFGDSGWEEVDAVRLVRPNPSAIEPIGPGGAVDTAITQVGNRWRYQFTFPPGSEFSRCTIANNGALVIGMHPRAGFPFVQGDPYPLHVEVFADNYDRDFDGTFGDPSIFETPALVSMNPVIDIRTEPQCDPGQIEPAFRVRYRNVGGVHQYGAQAWFVMPASFGDMPITFAGLDEGPDDFPAGATNHHFEVSLTGDGDPGTADESWVAYVPASHDGQAVRAIRVVYGTETTLVNRLPAFGEGSFVVHVDVGPIGLEDIGQCGVTVASIQTSTLPASSSLASAPFCIGMCAWPLTIDAFGDADGDGLRGGGEGGLAGWPITVTLSGGAPNVPSGVVHATTDAQGRATVDVFPGQVVTVVRASPATRAFDTGVAGQPAVLDWVSTTPGAFGNLVIDFDAPSGVTLGEQCACTTTNECRDAGLACASAGDTWDPNDWQCVLPPLEPGCGVDARVTISGPGTVVIGETATFTVTVSNDGQAPLVGVPVVVTLPNGLAGLDPLTATVDLPPGQSTSFVVRVVGDCAAVGANTIDATVAADGDGDPSDDVANVVLTVTVPDDRCDGDADCGYFDGACAPGELFYGTVKDLDDQIIGVVRCRIDGTTVACDTGPQDPNKLLVHPAEMCPEVSP